MSTASFSDAIVKTDPKPSKLYKLVLDKKSGILSNDIPRFLEDYITQNEFELAIEPVNHSILETARITNKLKSKVIILTILMAVCAVLFSIIGTILVFTTSIKYWVTLWIGLPALCVEIVLYILVMHAITWSTKRQAIILAETKEAIKNKNKLIFIRKGVKFEMKLDDSQKGFNPCLEVRILDGENESIKPKSARTQSVNDCEKRKNVK